MLKSALKERKTLFRPANGVRSTRSLVEIYSKWPLFDSKMASNSCRFMNILGTPDLERTIHQPSEHSAFPLKTGSVRNDDPGEPGQIINKETIDPARPGLT
jgi:hypothetical protein